MPVNSALIQREIIRHRNQNGIRLGLGSDSHLRERLLGSSVTATNQHRDLALHLIQHCFDRVLTHGIGHCRKFACAAHHDNAMHACSQAIADDITHAGLIHLLVGGKRRYHCGINAF